jgi:Rrf2 family protein
MISQTAEYALRAAVHLARHDQGPHTGQAISEATAVPPTYLLKILGHLTRAGLVRSQRGPSGGFALARSAREVTALDVIAAVDTVPGLDRCPLGIAEHAGRLCALHARLRNAVALMHDALRDATLHELCGSEDSRSDVCRFPADPIPGIASRKKEDQR